MRIVRAIGLVAIAAASVHVHPVLAQAPCVPGPSKLGVSRTVVIDTSTSPHFGAQYREASFLADHEVVLTFDDGPMRAYTRPILEALAEHCTKATFFMVGTMALADPQMAKEVAQQGHTVATHTWSHANLHRLSAQDAEAEVEMGFSAVSQALGRPGAPFFRFPYLRDTPSTLGLLRGRQIAAFSIDVDSRDYLTRNAVAVSDRVMRELAVKRKGIILMHDIHASTAGALPLLLAELKQHGFKVVHVKPKGPVETVARYDDLTHQAGQRRHLAAMRRPLAKRSLTWPATIYSQANAERSGKAPPPSPRPDDNWMTNIWR